VNCPSGKNHVTILESDPGKASTKIYLPTPSYSDDSEAHGGKLNFSATLDGRRVSVKKEHELSISGWKDHEVKYMVTDESEKTTMCYFYYRVLGKINHCVYHPLNLPPSPRQRRFENVEEAGGLYFI
jgi:hypothetical protein